MPRALTVSRVSIPPGQEQLYLTEATALAAELGRRGQHLWLFRHPRLPGVFLEFREAADATVHTAVAPTPAEASIAGRIDTLGTRADAADEPWLEVPLAKG